jgi:hypothetical protein
MPFIGRVSHGLHLLTLLPFSLGESILELQSGRIVKVRYIFVVWQRQLDWFRISGRHLPIRSVARSAQIETLVKIDQVQSTFNRFLLIT